MRTIVRILAFDSSGNGCSAAVWEEGRIVAREFEMRPVGQAERLVPMIERVLAASGLGFDGIALLAVTVGPGAFTGVRIGIATAQGLALGTGVPCLGLSSLETVAHGVPARLLAGRRLVVALDSRREELFLQSFDAQRRPLDAPALVPIEDWAVPPEPLVLAGDGTPRLMALLRGHDLMVAEGPGIADAGDLATLAAERWRPGTRVERLRPIYLRAPDVTIARDRSP
jgi:tRNA threonylcarbamoyladenosine biosynthesis protein TsaB